MVMNGARVCSPRGKYLRQGTSGNTNSRTQICQNHQNEVPTRLKNYDTRTSSESKSITHSHKSIDVFGWLECITIGSPFGFRENLVMREQFKNDSMYRKHSCRTYTRSSVLSKRLLMITYLTEL